MQYRNTKTGAIINSSCVVSGGDWVSEEPVKTVAASKPKTYLKKKEPAKAEPKTRKR